MQTLNGRCAKLNIRENLFLAPVTTAIFLAAVLSFPHIAAAVSIGEIVSLSKLGEPLSIRVELTSAANEKIDSTCLSLQAPDPNEEGAQDYLVTAKLAVKTELGRQFGIISSHKPFNEAFGKIRLQVNCLGQGSVTKTLTFLPDLDAAQFNQITAPAAATGMNDSINPSSPGKKQPPAGIALSLSRDATLNASPEQATGQRLPPASVAPAIALKKDFSVQASGKNQQPPITRSARKKRAHTEVFMFKLSSDPIDESRIGKISAEEREILLARQKLLDADDQMASFLAMQHQIKQLQGELGEIKLKLTLLSAGSSATTSPAANTADSTPLLSDTKQKKLALFAGGLVLAILALLLGLRYYNRTTSQHLGKEIWGGVVAEPASPKIATPPRSASLNTGFSKMHAAASPSVAKTGSASIAAASSAHTKSQEELSEVDAIIEEADLYSTYGHPDRAILMLQELIKQHPAKIEAWELLLYILASQKKVAEFEIAARDFMELNKSSTASNKIEEMRRSLKQGTSVPVNNGTLVTAVPVLIASGKRRLIGKILVETGILTALDMKKYLDDFDPKLDGRIGEYLVARQAISNEQLNEALRLQQSGETAGNQEPVDYDIGRFLPDSGPKQDERLNEYLKMDEARNNKPKKS